MKGDKTRKDRTKEDRTKKRVLVLGGAGLVGCNLCSLLAEKGYQVTALDKNTHNLRVLKKACPSVTIQEIDLTVASEDHIESFIKEADVVVQLQAQIMSP
ncbi:hypothetical protein COY95_04370, partial [Candidatus Woesearchaeota archaeon CG_4_10_14_0_8_um_filter_47_5]